MPVIRHKEINDNQSINNKCYFPIHRNSRVEFQEEKFFTKKMTRGLVPVWSYWTSGSLADHFLFRQHSSNYLNTQCKLIGVYINTKNMTFLFKFWFTRARDLKTSDSSRNSLNPTFRTNLQPKSDDRLCHVIDSCKIFGSKIVL